MTAILKITQYSDKSIIVTGETYPHRERIKAAVPGAHAIWHHKAKGWIFSAKHHAAVSAALADLTGEGFGAFTETVEAKPAPVADDLPGKWGVLADVNAA